MVRDLKMKPYPLERSNKNIGHHPESKENNNSISINVIYYAYKKKLPEYL